LKNLRSTKSRACVREVPKESLHNKRYSEKVKKKGKKKKKKKKKEKGKK